MRNKTRHKQILKILFNKIYLGFYIFRKRMKCQLTSFFKYCTRNIIINIDHRTKIGTHISIQLTLLLRAYPNYRELLIKTLQRRGNQVSISTNIEG